LNICKETSQETPPQNIQQTSDGNLEKTSIISFYCCCDVVWGP